ncbi:MULTISPECIES: TetR/AcrR family transcriptional regulator [Sphingomonadaceae]|uniref:AcrR family transcriptional regulator n=1 Tax=Sphingobium fontiphilum TaxID=944425 RepID=A0A7W6DHZ1_9SPHN|nr:MULTISPECIES: TetR/AcrR family transcriptional regulator [Sphingomonadaceae]MBB3983650.1 AcrR family transcriptional regulator [Sphingobium fontiphilum]
MTAPDQSDIGQSNSKDRLEGALAKQTTKRQLLGRERYDPASKILRVMAAAREEFALSGFEGAKVEHIARRAGVTKQLVYFYFASKDELYSEVLRDIAKGTYEKLLAIDYDSLQPVDAVRQYIGALYDRYSTDQATAIVTIDQSLHDGAQIGRAPEVAVLCNTLSQKIDSVLNRGKDAGLFGPHVDTAALEFMILIIVSGSVSSRRMLTRYNEHFGLEERGTAFWREYAIDFILRSISR